VSAIKYVGRVPKTLRDWCDRHAQHKVYEVMACGDPSAYVKYDAACRAGWSKCDDAVHTLVGDTVRELIAEIRYASPCDCKQCMESVKVEGK
jgi:hypothetical protein